MSDIHAIETPTHGRVIVVPAIGAPTSAWIVAFHGYGQNADDVLTQVTEIPGARTWNIAAVQALHRFYTRAEERIVASWMTRQDREIAIADNIEYVNRAVAAAAGEDVPTIVFLGFSQGASMAARAAARARRRAAGLILLGGDIPPDAKDDGEVVLPPTLVGVGDTDTWYQARVQADLEYLQRRGTAHQIVRFPGGHEFTDEFRAAAGSWLDRIAATPR